jgi:tRNA(Ile)-lysidine synthase
LPKARLHAAALARGERARKNEPWCVALSGGADSLALLLLLWAHWPERRGRLVALHFNHRLRGRAAEADAKFCARVCAGLGVPLRVGDWRRARRSRALPSEAAARAARQAFFAREMGRLGARLLWLAHQQDDVAETMLMRLARGSGTDGLAAPRPVQPQGDGRVYLRPLLTVKKAELTAALRAAGAGWREDATNAGDDYFRNRIRRAVLPAWTKAAERDALAGAALARERLEEDNAALEAWLDRLVPVKHRQLDLAKLAGLPRAIWRRALHRWLRVVRPDTDLSRQGFEQLLALMERGRLSRFSLGVSGFAVLRRGKLAFQKR